MKNMLSVLVCVISLAWLGSGCTSCSERANGTAGAAAGGFVGWFAGPFGSAAGSAIGSNLGSRVGVPSSEGIKSSEWLGSTQEGYPIVQTKDGKCYVLKNRTQAVDDGSGNSAFGTKQAYCLPMSPQPGSQSSFSPTAGQTINVNVYGNGVQGPAPTVTPLSENPVSSLFAGRAVEGIPSIRNSSGFSITIYAKCRGQQLASIDLAQQETKAVSWPVGLGPVQFTIIFVDPVNGGAVGQVIKTFQPRAGMTWDIRGYTQSNRLLDNVR